LSRSRDRSPEKEDRSPRITPPRVTAPRPSAPNRASARAFSPPSVQSSRSVRTAPRISTERRSVAAPARSSPRPAPRPSVQATRSPPPRMTRPTVTPPASSAASRVRSGPRVSRGDERKGP
jgi:hypothetical protein